MDVDVERSARPSPILGPQGLLHIQSSNALDGVASSRSGGGDSFEGRSPAPRSPAPTPRNDLGSSELQGGSQASTVDQNFAAGGNVSLATLQPAEIIQEKRYKQMQELELTQRLNDLRSKHGLYYPATIDTTMRLGGILSDQGRYKSAELLLKLCVDCLQKSVGEKDRGTLVASSKLAHCFVQQGQLSKAELLFRAVYATSYQTLSSDDRMFLIIKMDYANCIALLGNCAGAERELREVLTHGLSILPANDHILLGCMRYLAEVLKIQGKFCDAEKFLLALIETEAIREAADHLRTRALLGDVYRLQGKFGKAIQILKEVQEAQKKLLGSDHDQTLVTERILVLMLRDLKRFVEGEKLLRDAIKRCTKVLGKQHRLVSD
jgi:tetratricopeptide (TPR) repeat protein